MDSNLLKSIIKLGVIVVLFIIAIKLLWFLVKLLVPLAIVVIAVYIVYMFMKKNGKTNSRF